LNGAASKSTSNAADVASQAVTRTATGATQSLKELGKLALGGDAKAADDYMQKFLVSGRGGEDQYRILKTALDAGIIDKQQFYSGVGTKTLNLTAELRGHIPISINGVNVIDKLTPDEAKAAHVAMSVAKQMGNAVDEDALAKLATKAGKAVTNVASTAVSGLKNITGEQLKTLNQSLGYGNLIEKLEDPEYYNKFLKPALEKMYPGSEPDRVLTSLANSIASKDVSQENLDIFAKVINSAGGLPQSIVASTVKESVYKTLIKKLYI
jgi:hypothetical protein